MKNELKRDIAMLKKLSTTDKVQSLLAKLVAVEAKIETKK